MKLSSIPHLVKEWHPTKNGELTPNDITHGSDKKVWWLCSEGHSYDAAISKRTRKKRIYDTGTRLKKEGPTGCPFCTGQKASKDNNLLAVFPEIAKEWHPTKNLELTPDKFTRGSNRKVWWLCPKEHSYEMTITERTNKRHYGCPYCAGKKASKDNSLLNLYPEIAEEWHPIKNKELTPNDITYGSGKKVWWLCPIGHSYESVVQKRTDKNRRGGCPYCLGRKKLNYG